MGFARTYEDGGQCVSQYPYAASHVEDYEVLFDGKGESVVGRVKEGWEWVHRKPFKGPAAYAGRVSWLDRHLENRNSGSA